MEKECRLTREQVLMIIHNLEALYEIFLDRMIEFSAASRMKIMEARNKIHLVLEAGCKAGGEGVGP
jgi:hypothetical protein